jgi:hypothetical protein
MWWSRTNSAVHTLLYKYVECNAMFLNSSNGIVDTQYCLPNERSLRDSKLFYIIRWHYTIWQRGAVGRTYWQLTFDMDQKPQCAWWPGGETTPATFRSYSYGKMTALRGKSGKFFSPLGQHKLPPRKSVTSIPSPCLLVEGNHERSCSLWWWAEKKELWIQRGEGGGETRNLREQQ